MGSVNNSWLSQLAPAHQPGLIGWWPLAIGWWVLITVLILIIAGLSFYYSRPRTKIKRAAKKELETYQMLSNDQELAVRLEGLLRRYALTIFGREQVAKLHGEQWLNFIAAHGGKELGGESGQQFLKMVYGGQAKASRQDWLKAAENFIKGV
jgi:hypothetical protein